MAVSPARQRQGVASQLIKAGLAKCQALGQPLCVVLGEPAYYQRFGFRPASNWRLKNEYGVDAEFMAIEFRDQAIPAHGGLVRYGAEFADL